MSILEAFLRARVSTFVQQQRIVQMDALGAAPIPCLARARRAQRAAAVRAAQAAPHDLGGRPAITGLDLAAGARIALVRCSDPMTKLKPGDEGTVRRVDALGTVHVAWDNGSRLGLVPGEDDWTVLSS